MPKIQTDRYFLLAVVVILAVTILLFYKGITVSFSSDDYPHLDKNIHFKDLKQACSVFFKTDGREYRPFVRLSLWLNHLMGTTAKPFHWTNVTLHLLNVLWLFFILCYLVQSKWKAVVGSFIFAVHPIHSTNVNFILGRTDLICAFFYLCAILLTLIYLHHNQSKVFYGFSLLFFFFALLSKEMAISLPITLFFIVLFFNPETDKRKIKTSLIYVFPFIFMDVIYLSVRFIGWHGTQANVSVYTNFSIPHILKNLFMWMFGLFYPFNLYQVRDFFESRPLHFLGVCIFVAATIATFVLFIIWKNRNSFFKDKMLLFSIIWFFVILLPIVGGLAHRWYLYIPSASMSFFILAIWRSADGKRTFFILLSIYLAFYCSEQYKQSTIWENQSRISQDFLRQIKDNGLDKLDRFYFVNVPFGYKSAFLFTFDSLEKAISLNYNHIPDIKILSYINLSDNLHLNTTKGMERLACAIEQDKYGFFLFPPATRRFTPNISDMAVEGAKIEIKALTNADTVADYEIVFPEKNDLPIYYFDGNKILRFY